MSTSALDTWLQADTFSTLKVKLNDHFRWSVSAEIMFSLPHCLSIPCLSQGMMLRYQVLRLRCGDGGNGGTGLLVSMTAEGASSMSMSSAAALLNVHPKPSHNHLPHCRADQLQHEHGG